jgi:catechol-2,3-dioxygenase
MICREDVASHFVEGGKTMIAELGHTGLWVDDLETMRVFYENIVGLTVTDEDEAFGIVFLSSRPEIEHHEFVLQRGRTAPAGSMTVHQISWRVDSFASLQAAHRRLLDNQVPIQQVVTHGNALGVYFFDPEGNRNEFYWSTGEDVAQPFRRTIDVQASLDQVLATSRAFVEDDEPPYQPVS